MIVFLRFFGNIVFGLLMMFFFGVKIFNFFELVCFLIVMFIILIFLCFYSFVVLVSWEEGKFDVKFVIIISIFFVLIWLLDVENNFLVFLSILFKEVFLFCFGIIVRYFRRFLFLLKLLNCILMFVVFLKIIKL